MVSVVLIATRPERAHWGHIVKGCGIMVTVIEIWLDEIFLLCVHLVLVVTAIVPVVIRHHQHRHHSLCVWETSRITESTITVDPVVLFCVLVSKWSHDGTKPVSYTTTITAHLHTTPRQGITDRRCSPQPLIGYCWALSPPSPHALHLQQSPGPPLLPLWFFVGETIMTFQRGLCGLVGGMRDQKDFLRNFLWEWEVGGEFEQIMGRFFPWMYHLWYLCCRYIANICLYGQYWTCMHVGLAVVVTQ